MLPTETILSLLLKLSFQTGLRPLCATHQSETDSPRHRRTMEYRSQVSGVPKPLKGWIISSSALSLASEAGKEKDVIEKKSLNEEQANQTARRKQKKKTSVR